MWLIMTRNSELFWLLARRADAGLACVKPKRHNAGSEQKGQNSRLGLAARATNKEKL
jgi:hypothetical protein